MAPQYEALLFIDVNFTFIEENVDSFENKSPIIAVRKDGYEHIVNELHIGLMSYYDKLLMDKYLRLGISI